MIGIQRTVKRLAGKVEAVVHAGSESETVDVPDSPRDVPETLGCPPEDCVCELVRREGGWLWQQDLIELTGWSAATVSRLLSGMEADERIVRKRVGRSKAVGFPETLPDA